MAGSNIFSFASTKRKSKPIRDNISDPLSPAEIKYVESRTGDDASRSPSSARGQRVQRFPSGRPSLTSNNNYDAESQYSQATTPGPECIGKDSPKAARPVGSRSTSHLRQNRLRKEQSSSTLRSYYDRNKSPLAVSQQTSASSARDFALRKGCPPITPTLRSESSCQQEVKTNSSLPNRGASKKRPSRLDFTMLFPKPMPRSQPLLSPQRYTDSPPPLSAASERPPKAYQPESFLHDKDAVGVQKGMSPHHTQRSRPPLKAADSSFAKINMQKPRLGAQNWFDGLEGDVSEDDANREPDMPPDFVENAFKKATSTVRLEAAPSSKDEPQNQVWPRHDSDHPSSGSRQISIPVQVGAADDNQLPGPLHKCDMKAKTASLGKWSPVGRSQRTASRALDDVNLNEESVLCLSSSDDEDEGLHKGNQRQILEKRGPFLRDSIGVDSIDSDVEIGTAQAVNTSFLRTLKPMVQSSDLPDTSLANKKSTLQRLKAVEIPDRRSSRKGVQRSEDQMILYSPGDDILRTSCSDGWDRQPLSSKRSIRNGPAAAQKQSPLLMALTPQEASLLEAMRSKRASMRQNTLPEVHHIAADEDLISKSPSSRQPSLLHNLRQKSLDKRPANPPSTEPSLPSGRVSLIFSESVSSPTTGRDSPATPTLDLTQDVNIFHGLADFHDAGLHTPKPTHFGHARCRTGSNQIIVVDNFSQPRNESTTSEEYSWAFSHFSERANSAMIH